MGFTILGTGSALPKRSVSNDFGSIWALVNNAGITRDGLLIRMGDDAFDRVLDVNLKGTFNMTRALTKTFLCASAAVASST